MAGKIVVDTSVLIKWLKTKDEELLPEAVACSGRWKPNLLPSTFPRYSYTKSAIYCSSKRISIQVDGKKPLTIWKLFRSSSLRPPRCFYSVERASAKSST